MITRDTIKAIPEIYKGVQFRSKMEARFAKWCDRNKQKWLYEPEGLTNGKQAYLPDFYLPDSKMIVEIKPVFFLGETYKLDMLLNNPEFDEFALAVIEMGMTGSVEIIKYSPPEKDILDNDGEIMDERTFGRYWGGKELLEGIGFCCKCNSFNISISSGSWDCTGCGYYDGNTTIGYIATGRGSYVKNKRNNCLS